MRLQLCLILSISVLSVSTAIAQQRCENQRVTYEPFDPAYDKKMPVETITGDLPVGSTKKWSPQGTGWLAIKRPDFQKAGPWTTVVWIGSKAARDSQTLRFVDHGSGGLEIHWLNEKLIYGSIWWGRIVSTDFVYDFEHHSFLYREMANYGKMIEPCE